jgi:hypothetical protein
VLVVAATVVATAGRAAALDCSAGDARIVEVQVAGAAARTEAALAGCTRSEVVRAVAADFGFIALYGVGLALAASWFGTRGYRVRALRARGRSMWVVAGFAAGLDVVENVALLAGLSTDAPLRVTDPWAAAVAVTAWGKFVVLAGLVLYVLGALAGYVVTPTWVHERRKQGPAPVTAAPENQWTTGTCVSGGGVRSASFGLGALQALEAGGSRLAWSRGAKVTAVSGGSYLAGGWMVARTPRPGQDPPPGDAWTRRSPEELHLRRSLGYLLEGPGKRPGAVMTVLVGLVVNVAVLLALLWVVAVPLGWLSGSCAVEPSLRVLPAVDGVAAPPVACEVYGTVAAERRFSLDDHQRLPPLVWLGAGAVVAVAWVVSARFRTMPLRRAAVGFEWLHTHLGPVTGVLLGVGALLGAVLVAMPWAMVVVPNLYDGVPGVGAAPDEVAPEGVPRLLQVLASLGVLAALWRAVQDPLRTMAPRLGGVLVLAVGVLVGGQWATEAARHGASAQAGSYAVWVFAIAGGYFLLNPEWWSLAPFYRGRLRSAFATWRVGEQVEPHVGESEPSLYEYDTTARPTTAICSALNVSDRRTRTHHGIPAHSFTFTPKEVTTVVPGSPARPASRWSCHPRAMEQLSHRWDSPRLTTMTAVATSGAAVSPAMGRHNKGSTNALLALANLRLGLWLPNPRFAAHLNPGYGEGAERPDRPPPWVPYPRVRVGYLLKELFGRFDPEDLYVYVTDGGHWENTGLVELLRDGSVDEALCLDASGVAADSVASLAEAIGLAALELDTEVRFSLDPLRVRQDGPWAGRYAERSIGMGVILRPADGPVGDHLEQVGLLWYTKPALTSDARTRLLAYRERDDRFPAHPTADQFFDEEQFESYRMLGEETGRLLCAARDGLLAALEQHPDHAGFARLAAEEGAPWPVRELAGLLELAVCGNEGCVACARYGSLRSRLGLRSEQVADPTA